MPFTANPSSASYAAKTGVQFVRQDLAKLFPAYDLIADCLEGSDSVKAKGTLYLPMPDPANLTNANMARYDSYSTRAVFYNVTQRTALGLQGQIFLRAPVVKFPAALEQIVTDSNGAGISFEQSARDATWYVEGYGRAGLFIDYPPTDAPTTKAQQESGNLRPTVTVYGPKNIINWRTKNVGAKKVLTLVVLVEEYTAEDDGFETKTGVQYRELRLSKDNIFTVQIWRPKSGVDGKDYEIFETYTPKNGKGKLLDSIPFTFIGSKNNEPSIDPPPLYDLANLNIAHFRNSADYEEMIFILGQPTLCVIGLTDTWYKEILNKTIPFGSRSGLPLPEGADAKLLQVEENTAAKEGMEHKERQMVSLGAKLVEQKTVQRTATEAGQDNASEESVLSAIAKNVSAAMQWALEWCAVFMNVPETGIKYELNSDFEISRMSSEDVNSVIKSWQDGAISWTEMRITLRKAGRATIEDAKAKGEIDADQAKEIENAATEMALTTAAVTANSPAPANG